MDLYAHILIASVLCLGHSEPTPLLGSKALKLLQKEGVLRKDSKGSEVLSLPLLGNDPRLCRMFES